MKDAILGMTQIEAIFNGKMFGMDVLIGNLFFASECELQ